jgi:4-hydroxybenzoyl-CoA reductase subunit beta
MILPRFELHQPESLDEAIALLARYRHQCDILAGGSDLLPNYKQELNAKAHVVSLEHIPELRLITPERIGAMARLADLVRDPAIRRELPVVAQTAAQIASPLVIEQATIGGNVMLDTRCFYFNQSLFWRESKGYCLKAEGDVCLVVPQKEVCYATNSSDLAPVLIALGAELHLRSSGGERTVPIRDFYRHDGIARNVKQADELLTFVDFPPASRQLLASYSKLRIRDTFDFPAMGAAVALRLSGDGRLAELHICIGGVDTTPRSFEELTSGFRDRHLDPETIGEIAEAVMNRVRPYNNVPLSPAYRKRMVDVYLRRILERLAEEAMAVPPDGQR